MVQKLNDRFVTKSTKDAVSMDRLDVGTSSERKRSSKVNRTQGQGWN